MKITPFELYESACYSKSSNKWNTAQSANWKIPRAKMVLHTCFFYKVHWKTAKKKILEIFQPVFNVFFFVFFVFVFKMRPMQIYRTNRPACEAHWSPSALQQHGPLDCLEGTWAVFFPVRQCMFTTVIERSYEHKEISYEIVMIFSFSGSPSYVLPSFFSVTANTRALANKYIIQRNSISGWILKSWRDDSKLSCPSSPFLRTV